jgi:hypothetical protein
MTGNEINLDPALAASAGRLLGDSGSAFSRVRDTAAPQIEAAAAAAPWGTDALGNAFAKNYLEPATQLLEVWRSAADRTTQLGADIVTAVDRSLSTAEAAADRLDATAPLV